VYEFTVFNTANKDPHQMSYKKASGSAKNDSLFVMQVLIAMRLWDSALYFLSSKPDGEKYIDRVQQLFLEQPILEAQTLISDLPDKFSKKKSWNDCIIVHNLDGAIPQMPSNPQK
jgi:hypothetical protein